MKHIIHSIKNGHLVFDILDDNDKLIVGGITQPYYRLAEDVDKYIEDYVYSEIEATMNTVVKNTRLIEASPILQAMEETKENTKFELVSYIKANPDVSFVDFLDYCEDHFGWQEAGLIMKMIYEYVTQAVYKNIISIPDNSSKEYYFEIIKAIIINNSTEELEEMLK